MPVELCWAEWALTGSSSAAVLSENRAAASWERTVGSASFFTSLPWLLAWYEGSTNTKSVGLESLAVAFGASATRDAKGDDAGLARTGELAATVFASGAALATALACRVRTSFPAG